MFYCKLFSPIKAPAVILAVANVYTAIMIWFNIGMLDLIFSRVLFIASTVIRPNTVFLHFIWVRCTINRSHSTPCKKAEFEHLQFFPGHCLDFFLPVSGKICQSPIKKVKRQPTLIISFSQLSPFFEEQSKNPGWNPTGVIRYLGSAPGSLWQNSPHKDAFFCTSLTNIDQCWITCTFKVE